MSFSGSGSSGKGQRTTAVSKSATMMLALPCIDCMTNELTSELEWFCRIQWLCQSAIHVQSSERRE